MFNNIDMLLKLLAGKNTMDPRLPFQNAEYIKQLNDNLVVLDQNIKSINTIITELARDTSALQRAVIEFLKEKGVIETEEDVRLLQKLHMRHIAYLDQATAKKREDTDLI